MTCITTTTILLVRVHYGKQTEATGKSPAFNGMFKRTWQSCTILLYLTQIEKTCGAMHLHVLPRYRKSQNFKEEQQVDRNVFVEFAPYSLMKQRSPKTNFEDQRGYK